MALVLKDRVKETTTTTSTGTYTLGGAQVGYQSFAVVGDGNTTYYTVTDGTDWEVGIGTYTLSGTTLSRDTILESSNSGSAVNWGAGSKDVFLTYPAEKAVTADGVNPFTSPVLVDVNSTSNALEIRQLGSGNALLVEDSTNPDATPTIVDFAGNLILGKSNRTSAIASKIEVHSTSTEGFQLGLAPSEALYNWNSTSSICSSLSFFHIPSGSVGTVVTNSAGDRLGQINFWTQDGASNYYKGSITGLANSVLADEVDISYSAYNHKFTGPITEGVWNATAIGVAYGGTGQTSYAVGDLLYASASTTLSKLGIGAPGQVLQAGATIPEWGGLSGNVTTIQLRSSSTPGSVPTALSLSAGELVVNTADGKLYFLDSGGTVKVLSQADQIAPLTTKGDLLVNDGTSNVRLPVGTDTHVLTADSSVAAGVKWAAAAGGASPITISNKTGAYTVVAGDLGTIINCTSGTFTVSLTAAATLGSGFNCWVWNTGTGVITIDPSGAETIDGLTTSILRRGEGMQIVCDGTNWQTGDKKTMRGYAENIADSNPRPVASGNAAIAIGGRASSSGTGSIAIGGNASTVTASSTGALAIGYNGVTCSSAYGTAIGSNSAADASQAVSNAGAMALGGSYASGTDSFAAAVANNTSSYGARGANSIAIGYFTTATGGECVSLGSNTTASSTWSFAFGAYAQATRPGSVALGVYALSNINGKHVYSGGRFANTGDAQTGTFAFRQETTDATPEALTTNDSAPGTTNQVILPNNSAYAFTGTVVARQQASGGTDSAAWKVEGLIRREANAASTVLVNSALTIIDNTPGWTLALSADTTNGGLAITATGAAATNIRWVATISTSEVTYA
jgi:hypothetical protein